MKTQQSRKIFLLVLVTIGAAATAISWSLSFRQNGFNRAVWLAHDNTSETTNPRQGMLTDLIQNKLKPGLTRPQVIALLGKPAHTLVSTPNITFSYRIGADEFGVDSNWLDVEFDASGLLVKAYPTQT